MRGRGDDADDDADDDEGAADADMGPLEDAFAWMVRDRRSGTLRFEEPEGGAHELIFVEGVRLALRSSARRARRMGAARASGVAAEVGPSPMRLEQEMALGEEVFRRSRSAARVTVDEASREVPAGAVLLDAFDLLYRGVRALGNDAPQARALSAAGRPFVLHREAALDTFPLRPGEQKIVRLLGNLGRTVEELRSRDLVPADELVPFLHFLVVTHSAFLQGDETRHLVPLGDLTPEERLSRDPLPDTSSGLPPFASRAGLALFGLALAPLAVSLSSTGDLPARLQRTIQAHPELSPPGEKDALTMGQLLRAVPGGKLEGALLRYDSAAHWLCGIVSVGVFLGVLLLVFERGRARLRELPRAALFTGTAGLVFLLLVQWMGEQLRGVTIVPTGLTSALAMAMIGAVRLVSLSYGAALDPRNGFLLSLVAFTFGVGFCEEAMKALPVLDHFRKKGTLDVHGALAWGLASGIGLGVAEGVLYSAQQYNGVAAPLTYVVRFGSCVALHAIWSGAAAIAMYERRKELRPGTRALDRLFTFLRVIAVPMGLHGLYDTLLKRGLDLPALGVAMASFGHLALRLKTAGDTGRAEIAR